MDTLSQDINISLLLHHLKELRVAYSYLLSEFPFDFL